MTTIIYKHPSCSDHDTGYGHPECAARLAAILKILQTAPFAALEWRDAPAATDEQLMRVHPKEYIQRIFSHVPKHGYHALDGDTTLSPASGDAARHAAGAVCAAVDAVMAQEAHNAFCAVRPPGHHAKPSHAMGFCVFNNVAIGAAHARAAHGLARIAIVDFDVHHGNGTQACFERDPSYLYISLHQAHAYPGTGRRDERGAGNLLNLPLPSGSGTAELHQAWEEEIAPALRAFKPEILFISAGFDAHYLDPLAGLHFSEDDYAWLTEALSTIAAEACAGRVVSVLEGGYHLPALAASVAAHIKSLMS